MKLKHKYMIPPLEQRNKEAWWDRYGPAIVIGGTLLFCVSFTALLLWVAP